jgi:DNA-binding NarL/FixJ family response regulator
MPVSRLHPSARAAPDLPLALAVLAEDDVRRRRIATVLDRSGFSCESALRSGAELSLVASELDAVVIAADELRDVAQHMEDARRAGKAFNVIAVVPEASPTEIESATAEGAAGIVMDSDVDDVLALAVRLVCLGQVVLPQQFREKAAKPVFSARRKRF